MTNSMSSAQETDVVRALFESHEPCAYPSMLALQKPIEVLLEKSTEPFKRCSDASPGQSILLGDLHNDAIYMIIDLCFDVDGFSSPGYYRAPGFRHHPTLLSLSLVNKRLRTLCIPKLFRSVFRSSASMGELNLLLRDLEGHYLSAQLPSVLNYIRTCELLATSCGDIAGCRTRLARTLPMMQNLEELSITHRKAIDVSGLAATFRRANVSLPNVTALRIQSHGSWAFLVRACPNAEVLILSDNLYADDMMCAADSLKGLRHLELSSSTWTEKDIHHISEAIPDTQSLTLKGEVDREQISTWARAFGRLKSLRVLAMTTHQHVTDGEVEANAFDVDSIDGSSFTDMQLHHVCNEEQQDVATTYFNACRPLQCLTFVRWGHSSTWHAKRAHDGSLADLSVDWDWEFEYEPPFGADMIQWDRHRLHRSAKRHEKKDRDGFPQLLSFPPEVLFWQEWCDPPDFGYTEEYRRAVQSDKYNDLENQTEEAEYWQSQMAQASAEVS